MRAHFGSFLREISIFASAKNEVLLAWEFVRFGSLLREIRISVSVKNEVLPAWELSFHNFLFLCEFLVF